MTQASFNRVWMFTQPALNRGIIMNLELPKLRQDFRHLKIAIEP